MTPVLGELAPSEVGRNSLFTRRNFLRLAAGSAVGLAFYAGEIARHHVEVLPVTIAMPHLPDAFVGMRIVQISDIHFEEFTEAAFLQSVVAKVNGLRPDAVLLTGDFVSAKPLPHRYDIPMAHHCAQILSGIQCPIRYGILGNHDAKAGAAMVLDALETHKLPILADASVPLERGSDRIWVTGIRDALEQHPDLDAALPRGRREDREPLILLAHEPDVIDRFKNKRFDLVLSGHTHGGQVRVPHAPPLWLPPLGRRYVHGLFQMASGTKLYVNRGIGTVGLPFRFYCPPEITVFTLAQV
jgi:uncharacterized protein